jgi:hypothetical protein
MSYDDINFLIGKSTTVAPSTHTVFRHINTNYL